MIALLAALAAAGDPDGIARGDDLIAWERARTSGDPPPTAALLAFIEAWPGSTLAELAWAAARGAEDVPTEWRRRNRETIAALERSLAAHADNLERVGVPAPVAALSAEGEPDPIRVPWRAGAGAGAAFEAHGPQGALGLTAGRGGWSAVGRVQIGRTWLVEISGRFQTPGARSLWLSVGADSTARAVAAVGAMADIRPYLRFEGGFGVRVGARGPAPLLRLDLVALTRTPNRAIK